MPWETCFGRATDGIRQERYIYQLKVFFHMSSTANATPHQKPPLLFVGLRTFTK